jgi:site-specific DNA-adenine methylase
MNTTCPKCWEVLSFAANVCTLCGYDFLTGKGGRIADKTLRSPYPYFGSKARVVRQVWHRFGKVHTYIEPFLGSAAVAINCPYEPSNMILNDLNAYISNFWRAVDADPEAVAHYADWPINEADMHARHRWLIRQDIRQKLLDDPERFDVKIAGWWAWGQSIWLGNGWCNLEAIGCVNEPEGNRPALKDMRGVHSENWQRSPKLTSADSITRRKSPKIVNSRPVLAHNGGLANKRPTLGRDKGIVACQKPCIAAHGQSPLLRDVGGICGARDDNKVAWLQALQAKLRPAKVCCGDWSRVVTPVCWGDRGPTAIFLDPPYSHKDRDPSLYGSYDSLLVAKKVRNWAIEHGNNPNLRIAVCGYQGEHDFPADWRCIEWTATKGYSKDGKNKKKERIWFSPHCHTAR